MGSASRVWSLYCTCPRPDRPVRPRGGAGPWRCRNLAVPERGGAGTRRCRRVLGYQAERRMAIATSPRRCAAVRPTPVAVRRLDDRCQNPVMLQPLTIAVAQPATVLHDVVANADHHADIIRGAAARVVVFPELSLTGYVLDAEPIDPDDARLEPIIDACRAAGTIAFAGAPTRGPGDGVHISMLRIDGDGVAVAYNKMWLGGDEPATHTAGTEPSVIVVDGWRLGLAICKDTGVAEHADRDRIAWHRRLRRWCVRDRGRPRRAARTGRPCHRRSSSVGRCRQLRRADRRRIRRNRRTLDRLATGRIHRRHR